MWVRTKKCGTGVSQVLKYSTGVSRSTKRKERTIMPSSPGMSMGTLRLEVAHDKKEGAALAASAAPENCFRKLRREFMVHQAAICRSRSSLKLTPPARKRREPKPGRRRFPKG